MRDFPKVLDFGLAKVTEREMRPGSMMLTQEGMVFGTPEFMSPEQAQGKPLDARSDIYSLAVILYEMLTGKLPFEARTPMEYIQHHVTKPPIALELRVPGKTFPPGLGAVIGKALEKRPEDRFSTAAEFADALKPYAPGGGKGFSGLFPANNIAALEQVTRAHAEASNVPDRGPESQRNAPVSSRAGGGAGAGAAQQELAPRSQRGLGGAGGASAVRSMPVPSAVRSMPAPHSVRPPTKSGSAEGPTSRAWETLAKLETARPHVRRQADPLDAHARRRRGGLLARRRPARRRGPQAAAISRTTTRAESVVPSHHHARLRPLRKSEDAARGEQAERRRSSARRAPREEKTRRGDPQVGAAHRDPDRARRGRRDDLRRRRHPSLRRRPALDRGAAELPPAASHARAREDRRRARRALRRAAHDRRHRERAEARAATRCSRPRTPRSTSTRASTTRACSARSTRTSEAARGKARARSRSRSSRTSCSRPTAPSIGR